MIRTRQLMLAIGDIVSLIIAFYLMIFIRFGGDFSSARKLHDGPFFVLFILWLVILFIFDLYDIRKVNPNPRNIGRLALAFVVNIAVGVILFYIFPYFGITPKITLLISGIIGFVLIASWRRLFYKIFTSFLTRSIILIGDSPAIRLFAETIGSNPALGKILAIWKDENAESLDFGTETRVDLLISENHEPELLLSTANKLKCTGLSLVKAYEEILGQIPISLMTEERAMEIISKGENIGNTFIRRSFEIVIALVGLLISIPFLIIASIAIALDSRGSIIYTQLRIGKNSKPFRLYKLRSMINNAEKDSGVVWAEKNDSRITRVGKIIRKLHIDEIPQMWNVLIGDIGLVGPRPERPEFVISLNKEIPYYFLRHIQKPGFTGWSQIKFRYARSVLDSKEKFEYDLYYLANKSLLLDLGIVFKTVQIIFTH